ncbi:hypothetical protein [Nonomuraea sp. NPDC049784]|uniref:hypothetical protein n=1 Tax=Nonomuraea sp. NPDC049784 TaxID=3154361 RepID=UPI0034067FB9
MALVKVNGKPPWDLVLLPVLLALPLIVFAMLIERRDTERRLAQAGEVSSEALQRRIELVNKAFAEAATLMADLQRDLASQQAARERLIAQAEEQQRLLEIDEDQAEKIRTILVGETQATIRAERRQQWMFFGLGILVSIPIGVAINLLVP